LAHFYIHYNILLWFILLYCNLYLAFYADYAMPNCLLPARLHIM